MQTHIIYIHDIRCFSNVFTNILFASEVPTIPSRYAVNLIKGNREAWMHRIGSLLLRDSMGHHRHAAQALQQHCTMTLAASCTCFFFGSLMVTVELPQMFLSRKLDFSSWSFLCFKAKYVLGWVLCLFA